VQNPEVGDGQWASSTKFSIELSTRQNGLREVHLWRNHCLVQQVAAKMFVEETIKRKLITRLRVEKKSMVSGLSI
jgi:hypothetical protein